jgi:formylglycine-generating enzyme required for sulfatase activity
MAGKIFISYRRSETAWAARALFERPRREFDDRVFIDIEGLSLGIDYTKVIDAHLADCEVMLALIGHSWLQEIQKRAATVVDDDDGNEPDWVRVELTRGLLRGIPVVPVLIEDALLPAKKDLPTELKGLRNRNGMELHARFFDDQTGRLVREIAKIIATPIPAAIAAPPVNRRTEPPETKPAPTMPARESWTSNEGADNFGRWAEFEVKGVVQRMRWIAPGDFWMGSPETEKERKPDEHRHRVIHTRGFWLANTACTQALWQAVMGNNPSHFTGDPLCPVEQVSWDLIQQEFLPKLNGLVSGLDLVLPTEAQWEYACRAGTTTPFSFGENISTAQANFDGNHPDAAVPNGEYRKKTVPVKSLPPNPWGLYEMHGNVWEWCADGYGPCGADDAVDPNGVTGSAARVLRGGSWGSNTRFLRAAYRFHNHPDVRISNIGFRVCRVSLND